MRDFPTHIVAIAARVIHGERREWSDAMAAELDHVPAGPERWRFALGCARAALAAPLHPRTWRPGAIVTTTLLAGVAGCIAATIYVLTTWPHAAHNISRSSAWWFALSIAAYLWVAIRPPRALVAHRTSARRAIATGFALFAVVALGTTLIDSATAPGDEVALGVFLIFSVVGTFVVTGFHAARTERSFGAGVCAALWAGIICSLLAFNFSLLSLLTRFNLDVHMSHIMPDFYTTLSADAFMSRHVGSHLGTSMNSLGRVALLAIACGAIGAWISLGLRRRDDREVSAASP